MYQWWANEVYSQFGEDCVLQSYFRAREYVKTGVLDHIGPGFYVDIGSHHPFMLSNTWYFYQRGWRGINVDPTPGVKEEFDALRPEDINLQLAVAAQEGEAIFYSFGRAVNNTLDASKVDFGQNPEQIKVKTRTLASILAEYVAADREISFLSVDVEGVDLEVLQSSDWDIFRPVMVVVEIHEHEIEKILESDTFKFMTTCGYKLRSWTQPSLIFARQGV